MTNTINASSVVLISGGGKGVTAQCAIKLAQQYQCKFILLGRSSIADSEPEWAQRCADESALKRQIMLALSEQGQKPTPVMVQKQYRAIASQREIITTLQAIQQAGGQAAYIDVDITDRTALQQKLAPAVQRLGAVTGIIHGAGNLADKLIEHKTEQDFETVYSTKVEGLESLLTCIEPSQLNFLVLFSSFVGFYGNAGQADYALANEILNKSAHLFKRCYPACHVVAIGWGPWDGGMVTPQLKKHFAEQDIALISIEEGTQLLANELNNFYSEAVQFNVMSRAIAIPQKQIKPEKQTYRIRRKLTLAENSFACDHVIGSNAVLPAMCGIAWLANTCEQLYPGYRFLSCQNFKVLKGIVFDETLSQSYILDLERQKTESEEVDFNALLWSEGTRSISHYHYRCQIKLVRADLFPIAPNFVESVQGLPLKMSPYQDGTLFHRASFQSIQRIVRLDENGITAQCYLPVIEIFKQGQFSAQAFNSYTADAFFQCLLVWVRKFYDLGSLPSQFEILRQFKLLSFEQDFYISLNILSRNESKVIATATAYDTQGNIYIQIEKMQVTASSRLNSLFLENSCSETECLTRVG